MRHFLLFVISLLGTLCSCGNGGQRNSTLPQATPDSLEAVQEEPVRRGAISTAHDTASFREAFNQFFNALQSGDTAALNNFVDAQQGFWLIEQPGAVPSYTHFNNIQSVKRQHPQSSFISIRERMEQCQLQQRQDFPKFNCADMDGAATGFEEDGCFYSTSTAAFRNADMWKYADLNEQQAAQIQQLQQQIEATVLHTSSSFKFHFGYRNGRWQLLFADLRVPCSA
ncbi:MAG: hypothetical protein LPK03_12235 [Pontibacter sp.]|nr:hypothetical protein [Pontibacter sp.]